MSEEDWAELDALAKSTIRLHLVESVYFTVVSETTPFNLWKKLCSTYEKETASNKVYLVKIHMATTMMAVLAVWVR